MRPKIKFLHDDLILKIISEAKAILCTLGTEINNKKVLSLLSDHGAKIDFGKFHAIFTEDLLNKSLSTVPKSFNLYNTNGIQTHDFSDHNIHFTPGSTALNILDYNSKKMRKPITKDYIDFVKIVNQLKYLGSQSTALIPTDVHEKISDSYRLFLSLLYSDKPVVTGTFTIESFNVMKDFLVTVRGSAEELSQKPLAIFSCCPTSPLKWSDVTSQNVIDCGKYFIPVEFISMPLAGFAAPVTLTGSLIQHTAETLSGIAISQLSNPGTPVLYGGSPAIFDVRYETTPMGAIETMMIDCAYNEIGKYLGIPTQAYISLTDAKQIDTQAGIETGMGATLAALAGINNISGPGMIDFESCQSLEKLVIDNEVCGMLFRMLKGIEPKDDFPSLPIFEELLQEGHLLISKHTRKYLREEHYFPGPIINRANLTRWIEEGGSTLEERAHKAVEELISNYQPPSMCAEIKNELIKLMEDEAKKFGQDSLPKRNI